MALLFPAQGFAQSWGCYDGSVNILKDGKTEKSPQKICADKDRKYFASPDCPSQVCDVFVKLRKHNFTNYQVVSPDSNPGFKLCKELGLEATIVRYEFQNEVHRSNMCRSKKSFVNMEFLMKSFEGGSGK